MFGKCLVLVFSGDFWRKLVHRRGSRQESTNRSLLFRRGWSVPGWVWPFKAKRGRIAPCQVLGPASGLVGGRPTSPEAGRSLQQGRSGHYSGWKRWSPWPSRVQFTAEQMPRLTRDATAPQVPLALSLSP